MFWVLRRVGNIPAMAGIDVHVLHLHRKIMKFALVIFLPKLFDKIKASKSSIPKKIIFTRTL